MSIITQNRTVLQHPARIDMVHVNHVHGVATFSRSGRIPHITPMTQASLSRLVEVLNRLSYSGEYDIKPHTQGFLAFRVRPPKTQQVDVTCLPPDQPCNRATADPVTSRRSFIGAMCALSGLLWLPESTQAESTPTQPEAAPIHPIAAEWVSRIDSVITALNDWRSALIGWPEGDIADLMTLPWEASTLFYDLLDGDGIKAEYEADLETLTGRSGFSVAIESYIRTRADSWENLVREIGYVAMDRPDEAGHLLDLLHQAYHTHPAYNLAGLLEVDGV